MPIVQSDDRVDQEAWKKERAEDEADTCVAGVVHEHDHVCRRGSQCHCARPIGHPTPVALPAPRGPHR